MLLLSWVFLFLFLCAHSKCLTYENDDLLIEIDEVVHVISDSLHGFICMAVFFDSAFFSHYIGSHSLFCPWTLKPLTVGIRNFDTYILNRHHSLIRSLICLIPHFFLLLLLFLLCFGTELAIERRDRHRYVHQISMTWINLNKFIISETVSVCNYHQLCVNIAKLLLFSWILISLWHCMQKNKLVYVFVWVRDCKHLFYDAFVMAMLNCLYTS